MYIIKFARIIMAFIIPSVTFSQIRTVVPKKKNQIAKVSSYDSLSNFLGDNVNQYIGQELYLNEKPESLRQYGYEGFFIDYTKSARDGGLYKCCDGFNSKYSDLKGKYFYVTDVIKHPEASAMKYLYGNKYFLKLVEKESKDTVYYEYSSDLEFAFPFIVVGFVEKLKKANIGKVFVFRNDFIKGSKDIETGDEIKLKTGEKWICEDVIIDAEYYNLSLLLRNERKQKISIEQDVLTGKNASTTSFTLTKAEYYKKKFGLKNWETIVSGKVSIGMTKEMCKTAWGEPKKINETITSKSTTEQWVYDDNYLYFTNGVLTAIQ